MKLTLRTHCNINFQRKLVTKFILNPGNSFVHIPLLRIMYLATKILTQQKVVVIPLLLSCHPQFELPTTASKDGMKSQAQ